MYRLVMAVLSARLKRRIPLQPGFEKLTKMAAAIRSTREAALRQALDAEISNRK